MKTTKNVTIALCITVLCVGIASAQPHTNIKKSYDSRKDFGRQNYLMGLRSGHEGVIESSLIMIMKIRMNYPELEINQICSVLDSLIKYSSSSSLRYKALLASQVCDDPLWFSEYKHLETGDREMFYRTIAARLQQRIFSSDVL